MAKPIGQAGGGTASSETTQYKRWHRAEFRTFVSLQEVDEDFNYTSRAITYNIGDDIDDYAGGSQIREGDILEEANLKDSSAEDMDAVINDLFKADIAKVDEYNDGRDFGLKSYQLKWIDTGRTNYSDLTIGSAQTTCVEDCFASYTLPSPITTFNGAPFDVGARAFKEYGIDIHEFKNMKELIIHDESFLNAICGEGVLLTKCDLTDATSAFVGADLKEKDFIIKSAKGALIASSLAEGVKIRKIYIDGEDEYNIGENAFKGCKAELLQITEKCKEVLDNAFANNNFGDGLSPFPASITDYHDGSFQGSKIKSLEFPVTQATFHPESFASNQIRIGFSVFGIFKTACFRRAITGPSNYVISGNVDEKRAFADNSMGEVTCYAAINADGTFYETFVNNGIIEGPIYGRHTFGTEFESYADIFTVRDISNLDNSWRTFQSSPKITDNFGDVSQKPLSPCSAIVYYPKLPLAPDAGASNKNFGWSSVRDMFAYSREEAIAFSKKHWNVDIEWVTCAPREITVGLGSGNNYWEQTIPLGQPDPIEGTNSTIDPAPYYFYQQENPEGGPYLDSWTVIVEYQPWGVEKMLVMGDEELTGGLAPGYDYNGNSTAGKGLLQEGKGFWEISATRAPGASTGSEGIGFARTSRCIIEGELINPMSDENISINTDAHPSEAGKFISFTAADGHPLKSRANIATNQQRYWLQQLGEYVVNGSIRGNPKSKRLYVPADVAPYLDNPAFRNKHMFDGQILPIE
jgi:hypothetical protein